MDYTDILNSINSKLGSILTQLSIVDQIKDLQTVILSVLCILVILFAIRGE